MAFQKFFQGFKNQNIFLILSIIVITSIFIYLFIDKNLNVTKVNDFRETYNNSIDIQHDIEKEFWFLSHSLNQSRQFSEALTKLQFLNDSLKKLGNNGYTMKGSISSEKIKQIISSLVAENKNLINRIKNHNIENANSNDSSYSPNLVSETFFSSIIHSSKKLEPIKISYSSEFKYIIKENQLYYNNKHKILFVLGITFLFITFLVFSLSNKNIENTYFMVNEKLVELSNGNIPPLLQISANNQFNSTLKAINLLTKEFHNIKEVFYQISIGNIQTQVEIFRNSGELGQAFVDMRSNIEEVSKERALQKEDENQRNWSNKGLAQFADLLRQDASNIEKLSFNIISHLVKYLEANQAGLFILNDNDPKNIFIEMVSCFAYDRRKSMKKQYALKESLVGRCIDENETIYLTEIPSDYIEITSGLGNSNPRCLLIVPLKTQNQTLGAIEIASFQYFEKYHIDFVEKIGEDIASTLVSVKVNARTKQLLIQAQENAEEMAAQEEELRLNLEELQSTQEEANRKEEMAIGFTNSVDQTFIRADYDLNGNLIYANTKFFDTFDYTSIEILGKDYLYFHDSNDKDIMQNIFEKVLHGGKDFEGVLKFNANNDQIWLYASYTLLKDFGNMAKNVLFLAVNVNPIKKHEIELENHIENMVRINKKLEQELDRIKFEFKNLQIIKDQINNDPIINKNIDI